MNEIANKEYVSNLNRNSKIIIRVFAPNWEDLSSVQSQ